MKELKNNYESLKNKYSLPDYNKLNEEFELFYLGKLVEIIHPLAFIRRRMSDKVGVMCSFLQGILQPNPGSMVGIEESSFFSKEEKQKDIQKLLKELMYHLRESYDLDLNIVEENDAKFIKNFYPKWIEIKPRILKLSGKLKEGWKKETKTKNNNHHYMG